MIGANFQSLGLPHDEPDLAGLLVLQKLHSPGASLLPLIPIFIISVKLRFPENQSQITKINK